MTAIHELSATALLGEYASGRLSPVAVVDVCAQRIAELDEPLNAWQALCLQRAREEAAAAERAWRAGAPDGPLCGVPIGVKDLFDTAGVETACGSALLRGRVPDRDAEVVRRVRAAGAIVLGKTSTHEFACGLTMVNEHLGDTRNPHDLERTPGGSSGGSAVALATGMVPLALGSDTGGSIRWPAAACGIAGFKPSFGAVALEGCWPLAPSLDHAGPMARSVEDVDLLWQVIRDHPPTAAHAGAVTIAVGEPLGLEPAPAVAAALANAAALLRADGHDVRCAAPFDHMHARAIFFGIFHPEILRTHSQLGFWPQRRPEYTANVAARLEIAEEYSAADHERAMSERADLRARFAEFCAEFDLLLTPVCATAVPRLDAVGPIRDIVTPLTCPQDLLGAPSIAVRAGTDENGVPIGVQLTGAPGADDLVLRVARALERPAG